jgi:Fic family protein
MWKDAFTPYDQLPAPPPVQELLDVPVLLKAVSAHAALAELKGLCLKLPDPRLLLSIILLQESRDSSLIENIVTTNDQLYKALVDRADQNSPAVKEVLGYKQAVFNGVERIAAEKAITQGTALAVVQAVKGDARGFRTRTGTNLANPSTRQVIYTPPNPEVLPGLLAQWEHLVNEPVATVPLVRMAQLYYQFEAIHPFHDGNGRAGRILNMLYLVHHGLLTHPVLFHSSYIIANKPDYYRLLREVTEKGQWKPWVLYILDAVEQTARHTQQLIRDMAALRDDTVARIRATDPKLPAAELADLVISLPYVKVGTLEARGFGSRPTVTKYLKVLANGVLRRQPEGRDVYYINQPLVDLLARTPAFTRTF